MSYDRYIELLGDLAAHLASFGDKRWPPRLAEWGREFETAQREPASRIAHYERTRRALGGMGSIADVVIAPEAGHLIANDERSIRAANEKLLHLVETLDHEISRLLAKSAPGHD